MHLLYSKSILLFIDKIKKYTQEIFIEEIKVPCSGESFKKDNVEYPLSFVVFEHPSKLGYFNPYFYEIGINKCFLFDHEASLKNVLRHEFAHYLTFIKYGLEVKMHGKEFRYICKQYQWEAFISHALAPKHQHEKIQKTMSLLKKIEKLFALGNSPHPKEAEAALMKAKKLLLKYNLNLAFKTHEEKEMAIYRFRKVKRSSVKLRAIAHILRHFFVCPIFNRGAGFTYLEIFGEKTNVTLATYVGNFLDLELERLWKISQSSSLYGIRAKNSFFLGIAEGYMEKIKQEEKKQHLPALIKLKNKLDKNVKEVYSCLFFKKRILNVEKESFYQGKSAGKSLFISLPISKKILNYHLVAYKMSSFLLVSFLIFKKIIFFNFS